MKRLTITYTSLFTLAFLVLSFNLKSQVNELRFEHIGLKDGLSQLAINCIFQDSDGFIWVGTQSGLNKYSGTTYNPFIKYFNNPANINSLSDNWIYSIDEDNYGNLWIGTKSGLNKLNKRTNKITRYLANDNDPNSLSDNLAKGVLVSNDGYIWVKTTHELNKFDPRTEKFYINEHAYNMSNNINTDRGLPIVEDETGNLFIGSDYGLLYFDRDFEQFKYYNVQKANISNNIVESILIDKNNNIWVGTANGLNKFDRETKTSTKYFYSEVPNFLNNNRIKCIIEDKHDNLWIGTDGNGLNKLDVKNNKYYSFTNSTNNYESISHNTVYSLFLDKSNILWVGTYGGGLNKIDIKKKNIHSISVKNGLTHKEIAGMYIDQDRYFYVGLWGYGLNIIDLKNQTQGYYSIKHYSADENSINKISNNYPYIIKKLSDGNIWLGHKVGIDLIDPKTQKAIDIKEIYPEININSRVTAIIEDKNKNVWIGTTKGLYFFNLKTKNPKIFIHNYKDKSSLSNNNVYAVILDNKDRIWVGTENGLNLYDKKTGTFKKYYSNINKSNSLSNNNIYALYKDLEGCLWIATTSGLNKFNIETNKFKLYTTNEGLPDNLVYSIQEDYNGVMWVSTGFGIASINKQGEIRSFSKDDGSLSLEFNHGSYYRSKTGEIYFGGTEGISYFQPDSIKDNPFIPSLVFTKLSVRKENKIQELFIKDGDIIELTYKNNNLKLEFAAIEFTNPIKNSYKYKIDGIDENWQELGNINFIDYPNLQPGKYNIKVIGSNNDLVWNSNPISITIIIKPLIWLTKWAISAYLLLVLFIIIYYVKSKTNKLKTENQELLLKQLASLEIAKQKKELEIKNKNITDSINYAKRIQQAMMPSQFLFKTLLPKSFIFFKPKDVVSGDFYWIAEKNNKIFITAVDCTGHGVPGAFMSIIGFDLLRNITNEQKIEDPAEILNRMNKGVSETFSSDTNDGYINDGMDLSIIVIDKTNSTLSFAGAMNPVYVIRNNKIIEIKGNRFSVGKSSDSTKEYFDKHKIQLLSNDMIYIFSDGFPDQFGGQFGKKYKFRRFRQTLLKINGLPVEKQKDFLEDSFNSWKGELEQLDDVLVIGIKI